MRLPAASLLFSLSFLTSFGARAGTPASAADALKKLDAARSALADAVKRIEVDPPSPQDLEAAHAAVGILKDVIDAGATEEADSLDYAKAALVARRELRTHREFVDERRGKVKVHEHRRLLDAASAAFKERAKRIEEKEPTPQDFDEARASAKELHKALAEARPFAAQDQKFAGYLQETEALLAKQEKAVDDRWVFLTADKHRAQVEAARKTLVTAMAPVGSGATDVQFKAADQAIAALQKLLDDGKALEAGEKTYRAFAEQSRTEVVASKKKLDAAWTGSGLERLKAEIEPAYKDLLAAGKAVKGRRPSPEQLAEARTAAIVVRKLLEQFQPEAQRSQAFGQYCEGVKASLVDVEVQLQLRALEVAVSDVKKALRPLERQVPKDDEFEVARSALLVLEKTLETVHAKDPAMAPSAEDAKALLRDARAAATKKRNEVDVNVQTDKVEKARAAVGAMLAEPNLSAEKLNEAETGVKVLSGLIAAGEELTQRDRGYAAYDREVKKRVAEMTAKIARGRLALEVAAAREKLRVLAGLAKEKIDAVKQPAATDLDLATAQQSVEAIEKTLGANAELEPKDYGLQLQSDKLRNEQLPRLMENLEVARQLRDLRKKTGDALAAGEKEAAAALTTQDLRGQRAHYEKALAAFNACKEESHRVLGSPPTEATIVSVDGRPSTAKEVVLTCAQRGDATTLAIKPIAGIIAFEDGPRKSYEAAKGLMSKGKKVEAVAELDECTASGMILQHRNPSMSEQSFKVGGASMTLAELIKVCATEAKANRGK
jgi:hypothetical protein